MRGKITLSLSAIACILLISSLISILEYRGMRGYVSELIADNIKSINAAQQLSLSADSYNLSILSAIGDETAVDLPDFDHDAFAAHCDSLRIALSSTNMQYLADSVRASWDAYMYTSQDLPEVLLSDFIDSRTWYFEELQPMYNILCVNLSKLSEAIYEDLQKNSATFERGFYRSIIPGAVAVAVGLLLALMLMFYLSVYYVTPIYRMHKGLRNYRELGRNYDYTFEGDDQLRSLNESITDIVEENIQLRRRIRQIKNRPAEGVGQDR